MIDEHLRRHYHGYVGDEHGWNYLETYHIIYSDMEP